MWYHPKYYKELRKLRNKLDQVISDEASTEATSVRPGPGPKPRYTPTGILLGVDLGDKPQASSAKLQASSQTKTSLSSETFKQQAASVKQQAGWARP